MQFSTITVIIFFAYYIFSSMKLEGYRKDLRHKYNYHPWHYGYFADRKLHKMLNEEDLAAWKIKAKRFGKIQLYFFLYAILISMISGIFFGGKL